jgi:hypothetical protein
MRLSKTLLCLKGKEALHAGSRYLFTRLHATVLFYSTNTILSCNCDLLHTFVANYRRSKRIAISAKKEQIFWSLLSKAATFQFSEADLSHNTRKPEYVNFLVLWKYFLSHRRYFTLWSNSWPLQCSPRHCLFKRSVLRIANTKRLMKDLKLSRRIKAKI